MRTEQVQDISRMRLKFQKELQQQRTEEDSKVQEIRRQADEVRKQSKDFFFLFSFIISGCRTISLRSND